MWPMCYKCGMPITATPLRVALAQAGVTQTELAESSGIERTRLSRIVNGLHADIDTRAAIAAALGRHVDELWPPATDIAEAA